MFLIKNINYVSNIKTTLISSKELTVGIVKRGDNIYIYI
jgi:hypothetical protein